MARRTVRLTFRRDTLNVPVIYQIGKDYKVVTNIRRAEVKDETGWAELDLDGEQAEIERALDYCRGQGVEVQSLETA
ncbi:MAG: NIL domain-containing protein [Candidatus Dormibacteraeota bacterium]|nr:NIL domain-containing protein [Candidatus Dormibacteraeota bacterium]